jgi:uncharacterized surface protein with fasciclin (FAS1) repeats
MPTRSVIAAAALALAGLTLAACGGDDAATTAPADTTAAAADTTAAATDTTAAATDTTAAAAETTTTVEATTTTMAEPMDIASLVAGSVDFVQLSILLNGAGLTETLRGPGPFTVFAPTNEAFVAVGAETLNALALDPAAATPILTYHVVPGKVMSGDLTTGKVTTVNGAELDVVVEGGKVTVNGANVITADVEATNGVVHVIDAVLMPPAA